MVEAFTLGPLDILGGGTGGGARGVIHSQYALTSEMNHTVSRRGQFCGGRSLSDDKYLHPGSCGSLIPRCIALLKDFI